MVCAAYRVSLDIARVKVRWAHNEECHGVYCLPGITRYC